MEEVANGQDVRRVTEGGRVKGQVSEEKALAGLLPTTLLVYFLCHPEIPIMKAFTELGPVPLPPKAPG